MLNVQIRRVKGLWQSRGYFRDLPLGALIAWQLSQPKIHMVEAIGISEDQK